MYFNDFFLFCLFCLFFVPLVFCYNMGSLRYQCTPNDHRSSAPLYGRTVDANPTKVYIF